MLTVRIAATLTGEMLLHTPGNRLATFRVGGGIVLLFMALATLRSHSDRVRITPAEEAEAEDRKATAVVPLAISLPDRIHSPRS